MKSKKALEKLDNSLNVKVEKCVKLKHLKIKQQFISSFPQKIWGVHYNEVNLA